MEETKENGPDPLDICEISINCVLAIGTLRELANSQPEVEKYKVKLEEATKTLEDHMKVCKKCNDALQEKE